MPFSAVDAISPAIEHTRRQLLQPFRLGQWVRLAFVGLLAGEISSGGGCNTHAPSNFNFPHSGGTPHIGTPDFGGINVGLLIGMIFVILAAAFVLAIVLAYIGSVMRFILFDSILAKECRIGQGWHRRQTEGWRYFIWQLLFGLLTLVVFILLVGIPAGFAFSLGWFTNAKQHVGVLVLLGVVVFFALAIVAIAAAVIHVLTKDFVVPQMALEDIGAVEGWRRLLVMMRGEKVSYAAYVGMKILLAIAAGIVIGIVGLILGLIVLVPVAGLAVAAVLAAKTAGLGWTVGTITLAIVAGCVLLALFFFMTALISVPVIVFFPAYSIYFFAARYPALSAALYPAQSTDLIPSNTPPRFEPPPLPPAPEPI